MMHEISTLKSKPTETTNVLLLGKRRGIKNPFSRPRLMLCCLLHGYEAERPATPILCFFPRHYQVMRNIEFRIS